MYDRLSTCSTVIVTFFLTGLVLDLYTGDQDIVLLIGSLPLIHLVFSIFFIFFLTEATASTTLANHNALSLAESVADIKARTFSYNL